MKLPIYTTEGKKDGKKKAELNDAIFSIEPNKTVIYEDVRRYMANQRQGTAKTKERGDVRGGGRKAYRQKGTGMARRGSIRSPLLKGGGTVFGPQPRVHNIKMTRKMRRLARKSALSIMAEQEAITIIEDFSFEEPKTKKVIELLKSFDRKDQKVVILTAETDLNLYKSARNIPDVKILEAEKITTYQILDADVLFIQESAVDRLENSIEPTAEEAA